MKSKYYRNWSSSIWIWISKVSETLFMGPSIYLFRGWRLSWNRNIAYLSKTSNRWLPIWSIN